MSVLNYTGKPICIVGPAVDGAYPILQTLCSSGEARVDRGPPAPIGYVGSLPVYSKLANFATVVIGLPEPQDDVRLIVSRDVADVLVGKRSDLLIPALEIINWKLVKGGDFGSQYYFGVQRVQ